MLRQAKIRSLTERRALNLGLADLEYDAFDGQFPICNDFQTDFVPVQKQAGDFPR